MAAKLAARPLRLFGLNATCSAQRTVLYGHEAAGLLPTAMRLAAAPRARIAPRMFIPVKTLTTGPAPRGSDAVEEGKKLENKVEAEQVEQSDQAVTGSIRERLRLVMRRYGWWALGVYLVISVVDLSLTMVAIHTMGGDYMKQLQNRAMQTVGMGDQDNDQPPKKGFLMRWVDKAREALQTGHKERDDLIAKLSTEFVIAYGIHKTVLLPIRAAITVGITPSLVRWLIRRGWAAPLKSGSVKIVPKRP